MFDNRWEKLSDVDLMALTRALTLLRVYAAEKTSGERFSIAEQCVATFAELLGEMVGLESEECEKYADLQVFLLRQQHSLEENK